MAILENIFRQILSMSLAALPVMAAVLVLRLLLHRAPKKISYLLWAVVAFRLLCPVTVSSPVGLIRQDVVEQNVTAIESSYPAPSQTVSGNGARQGSGLAANQGGIAAGTPDNRSAVGVEEVLPLVWLAGTAAIVLYSFGAYLRLKRRVSAAVLLRDNIWQCDCLKTPFVLGYFRPRIYLPFHMEEGEEAYILLHEQTHLKRGDPWWKLLASGVLAVYWWNPAVWGCYFLFCRDMEMSCDEAVLSKMGSGVKRAYSLSLVSFASGRRFPAANPLAFGENDAKSRVKNILRWKRIGPGLAFLAVALCIAAAVSCCTDAAVPGSWIKNEGTAVNAGVYTTNFTYCLTDRVGSWAVYEDLYVDGVCISSQQRLCCDYTENPDAPRSGRVTVTENVSPPNGGWKQIDWTVSQDSEQTGFTTDLPDYRYTAMSLTTRGQDSGNKEEIPGTGGLILFAAMLSTHQSGNVEATTCEQLTEDLETNVARNDVVVILRLTTFPGPVTDGRYPKTLADRLYGLRNPYVGNMPADGDLLKALGVEGLGKYTVELFTSQEPYVLQIDFTDDPGAGNYDSLDAAMFPRALLLMALIDNLGEVRWVCPMRTDLAGENTHSTIMTPDMADSYAYTLLNTPGQVDYYRTDLPEKFSVKDSGTSAEKLQQLLDALADFSAASVEPESAAAWQELLNQMENNGFLQSTYHSPNEIDLTEVFYCGAGLTGTDQLSDEERAAYEAAACPIELDMTRITTAQADQFLREKAGISLTQSNGGLRDWTYLPAFDAYYFQHSDVHYDPVTVTGVTETEDYYQVTYTHTYGTESASVATLHKTEAGWTFYSNLPVS